MRFDLGKTTNSEVLLLVVNLTAKKATPEGVKRLLAAVRPNRLDWGMWNHRDKKRYLSAANYPSFRVLYRYVKSQCHLPWVHVEVHGSTVYAWVHVRYLTDILLSSVLQYQCTMLLRRTL